MKVKCYCCEKSSDSNDGFIMSNNDNIGLCGNCGFKFKNKDEFSGSDIYKFFVDGKEMAKQYYMNDVKELFAYLDYNEEILSKRFQVTNTFNFEETIQVDTENGIFTVNPYEEKVFTSNPTDNPKPLYLELKNVESIGIYRGYELKDDLHIIQNTLRGVINVTGFIALGLLDMVDLVLRDPDDPFYEDDDLWLEDYHGIVDTKEISEKVEKTGYWIYIKMKDPLFDGVIHLNNGYSSTEKKDAKKFDDIILFYNKFCEMYYRFATRKLSEPEPKIEKGKKAFVKLNLSEESNDLNGTNKKNNIIHNSRNIAANIRKFNDISDERQDQYRLFSIYQRLISPLKKFEGITEKMYDIKKEIAILRDKKEINSGVGLGWALIVFVAIFILQWFVKPIGDIAETLEYGLVTPMIKGISDWFFLIRIPLFLLLLVVGICIAPLVFAIAVGILWSIYFYCFKREIVFKKDTKTADKMQEEYNQLLEQCKQISQEIKNQLVYVPKQYRYSQALEYFVEQYNRSRIATLYEAIDMYVHDEREEERRKYAKLIIESDIDYFSFIPEQLDGIRR